MLKTKTKIESPARWTEQSPSSYFLKDRSVLPGAQGRRTHPVPGSVAGICRFSGKRKSPRAARGLTVREARFSFPKHHHGYTGEDGASALGVLASLRFLPKLHLFVILKVFWVTISNRPCQFLLRSPTTPHPYFSPPSILFVSLTVPRPTPTPAQLLAMFCFPQVVNFKFLSLSVFFIPQEACRRFILCSLAYDCFSCEKC